MRLGIAEILNKTSNISDWGQKVMFLRQNDSPTLRKMLEFAFDKRIEWVLPEGKPPYKPCPFLDQEGMLFKEMKRMYLFLKGGNSNLPQSKRENLFIQLLESIPKADAELLIAVKDHKMPYDVSESLVREAFPDLLLFPMEEQVSQEEEKPTVEMPKHASQEEKPIVKMPKKERKKDPTFAHRMREAREKKKQIKQEQEKENNNQSE